MSDSIFLNRTIKHAKKLRREHNIDVAVVETGSRFLSDKYKVVNPCSINKKTKVVCYFYTNK